MIKTSFIEPKVVSIILQYVQDFIIVGEIHGSRQNAPLMRELLSIILTQQKPITIAFEWGISVQERDSLRAYIHGGGVPVRLPDFFLDSDGRFTYGHISLLKWIRIYNSTHNDIIDLYTFDEPSGNDEADRVMADSLYTYKKCHTKSVILVETGNMHARTASYISMGTKHIPMATIIRKYYSVFSIFLQYLQGTVFVEGKSFDVTKAASQKEDAGAYFDATVEIPISEAAQNIYLTEISRLLYLSKL